MCSIYWVWKPIGWSPKRCVDALRDALPETNKSISYAARLDPMAYGVLPVVVADKEDITQVCDVLQKCYKTYMFKVISGVVTDTHDILGIPTLFNDDPETITTIMNKKTQAYPVYSSKTVINPDTGKMEKMFNLVNKGKPFTRPEHSIDIKYIKTVHTATFRTGELWLTISNRLGMLVETGFRLDEIRSAWADLLFSHYDNGTNTLENTTWIVTTYEACVSPGTYIRCIANDLGGTAYDICRIETGGNYFNETSPGRPYDGGDHHPRRLSDDRPLERRLSDDRPLERRLSDDRPLERRLSDDPDQRYISPNARSLADINDKFIVL